MYKYCYKAQDFINFWCGKLKLPTLWVKLADRHYKKRPGAICIKSSTIILWQDYIEDREKFVKVLLHELVHWMLYWRYKDNRYKDELQVIKITDLLFKKYYPIYWSKNAKENKS